MYKPEIRKKIADEGYTHSLFYDNEYYDDSIIGVDVNGKVVYEFDQMIEEYVNDNYPDIKDENSEEYANAVNDAIEWIEYNTIRATPYAGELAPVIIQYNPEYYEEIKDKDAPQYINMINGEPYNIENIVFKICLI